MKVVEMLKPVVLIMGLFEFTLAIVVPRIDVDNPTTYPTELYKPLTANTEEQNEDIMNKPRQGRLESDSNNPLSFEFGELGNLRKYTVVSTYAPENDNPFKYLNTFLSRPVFMTTRFESLNSPYPLITHNRRYESDASDIILNPKNKFVQISSSNTYFDSDTMEKPITRHYKLDTRNGNILVST